MARATLHAQAPSPPRADAVTVAQELAQRLSRIYGRKATKRAAEASHSTQTISEKYYSDPVGFATDVLGIELTEDQKRIIRCFPGRVKVNSGHSLGKAQPVSTIIDTPHGQRRFGDIKPGDWVFGVNGNPVQVTAVHPQGVIDAYKVTFDDRSETVCSGSHLWTVRGRRGRRNGSGWGTRQTDGWEILTTEQIIQRGVLRNNGNSQYITNWELPQHESVVYPEKSLPVPAYTMGVWLGDGCTTSSSITTVDQEIIDQLILDNPDHQVVVRQRVPETNKLVRVYGLMVSLRDQLEVLGTKTENKRVPKIYLENSAKVRLAVLQGLMDTDGTCGTEGCSTFCSTSRGLVEDVVWLVRSLGGKASIHPSVKKPKYKYKGETKQGKDCFIATVRLNGKDLFRLTRKQKRVEQKTSNWLSVGKRMIKAIEPAAPCEMVCITVDSPDGLYLTNDFIVTHNSFLAAVLALWWYYTRDPGVVVTTAPTQHHVSTVLWAEIRLLVARAKVPPPGSLSPRAPLLYHHPDHWLEGYTAAKGEGFQGRHRPRMLFIFDESEGLDGIYWKATDTMFRPNTEDGWFAIGNPLTTASQSYIEDLATGPYSGHKWNLFELSALNHPNIAAELAGNAPPIPTAVTLSQVEQWIRDWCEPIPMEDAGPEDLQWPPTKPCPECSYGEQEQLLVRGSNSVSGSDADVSRAVPDQGRGGSQTSNHPSQTGRRAAVEGLARAGSVHEQLAQAGGTAVTRFRPTQGPCPRCESSGVVPSGIWYRPGPAFKGRVLGKRPTEGIDTVWSETLWELAIQPKWTPLQCWEREFGITIGVDVATYGDDDTTIHVRCGPLSLHHEAHNGWLQDKTARRVIQLSNDWAEWYNQQASVPTRPKLMSHHVKVIVEMDGPGAGVMSHQPPHTNWIGVQMSSAPTRQERGKDIYLNLRSQMWFQARERARASWVDLSRMPSEVKERLKLQLLMASFWTARGSVYQVESKEDIKTRMGRSPDDADAFMLSHCEIDSWLPKAVVIEPTPQGFDYMKLMAGRRRS